MKRRFSESLLIDDWYEVKPLLPDLYCIDEQDHVAFFVIKFSDKGLFIDSGLGLVESKAKKLLQDLGISEFRVLATHSHCDHSGLNYLATDVAIFEDEWIKFQELKEEKQLTGYYKMLRDTMPWPSEMKIPPATMSWRPTTFVAEADRIQFGEWDLEALLLPGHSRGHLIYFDRKKRVIFLGDFLITGFNFIHLRDSSIATYLSSLKKLARLIKELVDPTLLPCHNEIPLRNTYVADMAETLEDIKQGRIQPVGVSPSNDDFAEAYIYDTGTVRLVIRTDQIQPLRSDR